MEQWVPFREGEYLVEEAFIMAPDGKAMPLENSMIEVFEDEAGLRHLRGRGMGRAYHLTLLMEDADHVDLMLDLGGEFKYRMPDPEVHSGKIFSPDVRSIIQFGPSTPWEAISEADYAAIRLGRRLLDAGD